MFGWLLRLRAPQATACCAHCQNTAPARIEFRSEVGGDAIVKMLQDYARRNGGLGGVNVR